MYLLACNFWLKSEDDISYYVSIDRKIQEEKEKGLDVDSDVVGADSINSFDSFGYSQGHAFGNLCRAGTAGAGTQLFYSPNQ